MRRSRSRMRRLSSEDRRSMLFSNDAMRARFSRMSYFSKSSPTVVR